MEKGFILFLIYHRTFTSTEDDDDDDHDTYNERPSEKYQKPKQYSFAGLIVSRLIRESCKYAQRHK